MAATKEEVERLLRRLFNGGSIERVPKNRKDAEAFLALAASHVESRSVLTETELNEQLSDWLDGVANQNALDHVTLRRYLVDLGMLFRDAEGQNYQANQTVIGRYINPEARAIQPSVLSGEVELERAKRRRSQQNQ